MKKNYKHLISVGLLFVSIAGRAQFYSVKTNLLGLATGNLNVEASVSVHRNWTLHLPVNYNPWIFPGNKKLQNITLTPGTRYWFLESYAQHFIGIQALYSRFHVGGILGMKYRYDGWGAGAGFSYGYSKLLDKRWSIEFEAGIGAMWADYTKYECRKCGTPLDKIKKIHLVPTSIALNAVYLF